MKIAVLSAHTPSLQWFRLDMMQNFINRNHSVVAIGNEAEANWKPVFEKYRKEDYETKPETNYREEIDRLWTEINSLKERRNEHTSNGSTIQTKPNGNVKSKVQYTTESK